MNRLRSKMPGAAGTNTKSMYNVANLLGFAIPSANLYQSENKLIQKYLLKLDDFHRDMRFLHDEV